MCVWCLDMLCMGMDMVCMDIMGVGFGHVLGYGYGYVVSCMVIKHIHTIYRC